MLELYQATLEFFDQLDKIITILTMLFSGLAMVVGYVFGRLRPNRFPNIDPKQTQHPWEAVIFTVSRVEVPQWIMEQFAKQQLKYVAFIGTEASAKSINTLKRKAAKLKLGVLEGDRVNPDNAGDTHDQVKILAQQLQQKGIRVIAVDITGGKVPMSVGAFMGAEEMKLPSLYASSTFVNGKPDTSTTKLRVLSQPKKS